MFAGTMLAALTALGSNPSIMAVEDRVDLIEVNHFHDEQGRPVFDQLIFYEWSRQQNRFHVRAWRLIKTPQQVPTRSPSTGLYQVTWHDAGLLRQVHSPSMRETWTQYDPELVDRSNLPQEQRLELTKYDRSVYRDGWASPGRSP